jgi:hypothetical protein
MLVPEKAEKEPELEITNEHNSVIPEETEYDDGKSLSLAEAMPLLFVDVNLGDGQMSRIVLYEGDNPEEVAELFGSQHNLEESMKSKLAELLQQQLVGLLAKINEDDEDN